MKRKILTIAAAGILAISTLAGCGGGNSDGGSSKIRVAATAAPHAEILQSDVVRNALSKEGYELEVKVFQDYVQPNNVVESGELDANYFQHITYLNDFNKESGTHLVSAGGIHYEPFGIYAGQKKDLSELADGDSIAVPNDTTNEARALLLLQDNDFIKHPGSSFDNIKMTVCDRIKRTRITDLHNHFLQFSFIISDTALFKKQMIQSADQICLIEETADINLRQRQIRSRLHIRMNMIQVIH
jgi:D-methionine transport system substrate-binding protein